MEVRNFDRPRAARGRLSRLTLRTAAAAATGLLFTLVGGAATAATTYHYFPTSSTTDGRFLALAGKPLNSLAGQSINIAIQVPSGSSNFQVGIFDGDTGKDATGALNPAGGHWDMGTSQLIYTLYADPAGNGTGNVIIGQWTGNDPNPLSGPYWTASAATMPDNGWWTATVNTTSAAQATDGSYSYNLVVSLQDPTSKTNSDFKIRTTGNLVIQAGQTIGIEGALHQVADGYVIYPQWNGALPPTGSSYWLTAPTTYDGTWTIGLQVPPNASDLTVWDGDFDFGNQYSVADPSGLALPVVTNPGDPDTMALGPNFIPSWAAGTTAIPDGFQVAGDPPDDNPADSLRRSPSVIYNLTDPLGNVYWNNKPSGSSEWEQFKITTDASAGRNAADYGPAVAADGKTFVTTNPLPGGVWSLNIKGLDLDNTVFLHPLVNVVGVIGHGTPGTGGTPQTYNVCGTVFVDANENGTYNSGESAISGVKMYLENSSGAILAAATTASDGTYKFQQVQPGTYTVVVPESNFASGGPLNGLTSTTGGNSQTVVVTNTDMCGANFGYAPIVQCTEQTTELWPPNHKMRNVGLQVHTPANSPVSVSISVFSTEPDLGPDADKNFSPDAKPGHVFTPSQLPLFVRAERGGQEMIGRIYLVIVKGTDQFGNTGQCTEFLWLPHDQSAKSRTLTANKAAADAAYAEKYGTPPSGYYPVGDGPNVGPKP